MLYFYQSISPHKIENLHQYLDSFYGKLFQEVHPIYNLDFFISGDFKHILEHTSKHFSEKLEDIVLKYFGLSTSEKILVKKAYLSNIDIQGVCNSGIKPYKYSDLPTTISYSLESFYDVLWGDNKVLGYKKVVEKCGTIKEHFNDFRKVNLKSVCPFCGLEGLDCEHDDGKDDYDHYLHKSKYPFISVHFLNLFPMCKKCNSKSKGQKDAPFDATGVQRPIYFPFENSPSRHSIFLRINSTTTDLSTPTSWTLDINCTPIANIPKKDAWVDIFNIETRYKARIAKDSYHYKDKLIKDYKKKSGRTGFDFDQFRDDKLDDLDDIYMQKEGIIWKTFHEFVLNDPDFENNVNGIV